MSHVLTLRQRVRRVHPVDAAFWLIGTVLGLVGIWELDSYWTLLVIVGVACTTAAVDSHRASVRRQP